MKVGDKFRFEIPPNLAYSPSSPSPKIPPNITLVFQVESRLVAVHAVAHGDNGIEIVKLHRAGDLAGALRSNYFHFGNSCFARQFARFKNVFQVLVDSGDFDAEKLGDGLLCQPDGFTLKENLDLHRPLFGGVEEEFALLVHNV
jgi:hypothetical protein